MLRIWPLYFFIGVLGFVVLPLLYSNFDVFQASAHYYNLVKDFLVSDNKLFDVFLFILFLSNVLLGKMVISGISHTWSVSKEQFYLIWPQVLKIFGRSIALFALLYVFMAFVFRAFETDIPYLKSIVFYIKMVKIDIMIIGGLLAFVRFKYYPNQLPFSAHAIKYLQAITLIIVVVSFWLHFDYRLKTLLYCVFIFSYSSVQTKLGKTIGSPSYGIYMYHPFLLAIFPALLIFMLGKGIVYQLTYYLVVIGFTVLLSHYSKRYFEDPFLRIKKRFK